MLLVWEWHLLRITRSAAANAQQSKACAYSSNDRTRTTAAMAAALGIGRLFNAVRRTGCWFNLMCSIGKEFRQRDKHRRLCVQHCRTRSAPHLLPASRRQQTHAAAAGKRTHSAAAGKRTHSAAAAGKRTHSAAAAGITRTQPPPPPPHVSLPLAPPPFHHNKKMRMSSAGRV